MEAHDVSNVSWCLMVAHDVSKCLKMSQNEVPRFTELLPALTLQSKA